MKRKHLFDSLEATRSTDFSWSAVNHGERKVFFGAWTNEAESEEGGRRIFSKKWETNEQTGRRNNSYTESYRNIEYVLLDGYRLFTFPMWRKANTEKIQISHIDPTLQESFLICKGSDYFAIGMDTVSPTNETEEADPPERWEGAKFQVLLTGYERNNDARSDCLGHHGHSCVVCTFNFENEFGEVGTGFIHVHHLTRMVDRPKPYVIEGRVELVPVCPNCHAMIHKKVPPYSIEEIKTKRDEAQKRK